MSQTMSHASTLGWTLLFIAISIGLYMLSGIAILAGTFIQPIFGALAASTKDPTSGSSNQNATWNAPNRTQINDLNTVIDGTGVYGFVFNNSYAPPGNNDYYGGYNWCNMPHVNQDTYVKASAEYVLEYVEVIHRHHKRTPYSSNTFPHEFPPWGCSDEGLFHYAKPINPPGNASASTYWSVYTSPSNPFTALGINSTCQFPQITRSGLDDSHQHGKDLYAVYHNLLNFLPETPDETIKFRVTNNPITSQVASMIVNAMFNPLSDFPLLVQPPSIDSLEPSYPCPVATSLSASYGPGSTDPSWTDHLTRSTPLFAHLDDLSGVDPSDQAWHKSWDHYFDNLSARLCHAHPLPCSLSNPANCINDSVAEQVFRLGEYEYSFLYRDSPLSLKAATAAFGVYVAELAQNLRDAINGGGGGGGGGGSVRYRHNVAHDGSLARLLSILQVDRMVWPGMGAEIVFELYRRGEERFVRVLWGGEVLKSSSSMLGLLDLTPVDRLLGYFDELVGVGGEKVPGLCAASST